MVWILCGREEKVVVMVERGDGREDGVEGELGRGG